MSVHSVPASPPSHISWHVPPLLSSHAGKVEADVRSEMRTNMDVDAGEEHRDDGLRVQVRARVH